MKINRLKIALLAFCTGILLSACSKDDKFAGSDNYIHSFTLTQNGVTYRAVIKEKQIELTVPSGVDLQGAAVSVELCELASISPDPSTLKAWDESQSFTVTSHNQSARTFTYSVVRSDLTESGNVVLRTQAEVDAFGKKGVSAIDGHLTLGDAAITDPKEAITDLSTLSRLISVSGNLMIRSTFNGKTLEGLANLQKIGNLFIGSATTTIATLDSLDIELPGLQSAGEIVINNNKVKSLSLPALTGVYTLFVNSNSMKSVAVPQLKTVYGNFTLQSGTNASASTANAKMTELHAEALTSVTESLTLQGLIALKNIQLGHLQSIGGNLQISYLSALTQVNMEVLSSVDGKMTLSNLAACTALSLPELAWVGDLSIAAGNYSARPLASLTLPKLQKITNSFDLSYAALVRLELPSLEGIGTQLKLGYIQTLEELSLPKLTVCPTLYLSDINLLSTLDIATVTDIKKMTLVSGYALSSLMMPRSVGDLEFNGGSRATAIPVLEGLEEVTGTLTITNYKATAIAFSGIKKIGTYTQTSGSGQTELMFSDLEEINNLKISLTDLKKLSAPQLKKAGSLDWNSFWNLTTIDLGALEEITGAMKLWGASYSGAASKCLLTDLDFLNGVTKIGSVDVKWCGNLTDFSGLSHALSSLSESSWSVAECKYNPTFQQMLDGAYVMP